MRSNWLRALRPAFIPASLIPVLAGLTSAWRTAHTFNVALAAFTLLGIALAHMSADLFNDYFDYLHGTDQLSRLRGLSGGTGVLVEGALTPKQVLVGGFALLMFALACGIYLTVERGFVVLALMLVGGATVIAYTSVLQRVGLGELTLAADRVATALGAYYVQARSLSAQPAMAGLLLGVLSIYMVYYAAIPDYEADSQTGKKTLVVLLGRARAIALAPLTPILAYGLQAALVLLGLLPATTLLTLLAAPAGYLSIAQLRRPDLERALPMGLKYTALFTRLHGVILALSLLF